MTERPRSAVVLLNPVARRAASFDPYGALQLLGRWNVDACLLAPSSPDEFVAAARNAARERVDIVFVVGGDGALRLVAGELAGSGTALAPIPAGTANVWALETGTPRRWDRAIEAHLQGVRIPMDLGRADDEPFLLMAGIGWDAAIASRVSPGLKRRIGPGAYIVEAARALPRLHPNTINLEIDGTAEERDAGLIVLGNTRLYGGVVEFTPGALADDGAFDVCIAGPRRRGEGAMLAGRLALHRLRESPGLHFSRASCVTIHTPGIAVQVDGDPIGETPMSFRIEPRAVLASIPSGSIPPVFSSPLPGV